MAFQPVVAALSGFIDQALDYCITVGQVFAQCAFEPRAFMAGTSPVMKARAITANAISAPMFL
jgi:hypothetical protein